MVFGFRGLSFGENIWNNFGSGLEWFWLFALHTHATIQFCPKVFSKHGIINSLSMCVEHIIIYHSQMKYYSVFNVIFQLFYYRCYRLWAWSEDFSMKCLFFCAVVVAMRIKDIDQKCMTNTSHRPKEIQRFACELWICRFSNRIC